MPSMPTRNAARKIGDWRTLFTSCREEAFSEARFPAFRISGSSVNRGNGAAPSYLQVPSLPQPLTPALFAVINRGVDRPAGESGRKEERHARPSDHAGGTPRQA